MSKTSFHIASLLAFAWAIGNGPILAAPPSEVDDTAIDLEDGALDAEESSEDVSDDPSWRFVIVKEFENQNLQYACLRFSHDGSKLCVAGEYGECIIWDTSTWEEVLRFKNHTIIWDAAFSTDDKQLLTCGEDGTLALWDLETGKVVQAFRGHRNAVRSCAVSPDGHRVMGGGGRPFAPFVGQPVEADFSVRIWEVESGREVATLEAHHEDVRTVAFLADENQVLSTCFGDDMLIVWDLKTAKPIHKIAGIQNDGADEYVTAALSPDRRQVLTFGQVMFRNGMMLLDEENKPHVRLWDITTGKQALDYGPNTRGEGQGGFGPLPGTFVTVDLDWVVKDDLRTYERVSGKAGDLLTIGTIRMRDVRSGDLLAAFSRGGPRFNGSTLTGPIATSPSNNLIACTQSAFGLVVLKLIKVKSE